MINKYILLDALVSSPLAGLDTIASFLLLLLATLVVTQLAHLARSPYLCHLGDIEDHHGFGIETKTTQHPDP
jgi:hypothetical protein